MQVFCAACERTLEFTGERPRFCAFCGQPLASANSTLDAPTDLAATVLHAESADDELPVDDCIGGYRLLRRLGGGGMGAVYEAEDRTSGRRVALKLVLPEYAGSAETLLRFRQEGRLASTLVHPRCVFVLAADEDAGRPYIVMELMPGLTLDDVVRTDGPLSVADALTRILDVIDGLQEAHRRGLVHRDVKPSNCFVDLDGRVKIGDFGLARSLVGDTKLTRTGAFVGTPLYAAPEQIHKREPTDAQSDVYSVAATLYFLLTGQAPFQSAGDATTTLARIISEAPPSLRLLRPELPRALDRIVMRGLARDRLRRWRDLDELRRALLPLLPAKPSVSGLGLRVGAYMLDGLAIGCVGLVVAAVSTVLGIRDEDTLPHAALMTIMSESANMAYFSLSEGLFGWSLGKRLLRLRVAGRVGDGRPGVARAVLRIAAFDGILYGPVYLMQLGTIVADIGPRGGEELQPEEGFWLGVFGVATMCWYVFALGLLASTMRTRTGYRGLHELLSGTRTYQLRWPRPQTRRALPARAFALPAITTAGMPERVGSFRVRGVLHVAGEMQTLLAEDEWLGRRVWLLLRPTSAPPIPDAERQISRATRLRWLGSGTDGDRHWDAFVAPAGMPLSVLAAGTPPLTWAHVRPLLEDLAEELDAARVDGTLPPTLAPEQLWVEPDGRPVLLSADVLGAPAPACTTADEPAALHFLRLVAVTALEGQPRASAGTDDWVRAPVPQYAAEILERLLGGPQRYQTLAELRQDLEATRGRPAEVSRGRRVMGLLTGFVLAHLPFGGPTLLIILALISNRLTDVNAPLVVSILTGTLAWWVGWAVFFRGGYGLWTGGTVLRRADGRRATRLQCGLRMLLVWGPLIALDALAVTIRAYTVELPWLDLGLWCAATASIPLYALLALLQPTRSVIDRAVGTYLLPD